MLAIITSYFLSFNIDIEKLEGDEKQQHREEVEKKFHGRCLFYFVEINRGRIDAVAQAGWRGAIGKNVAEV